MKRWGQLVALVVLAAGATPAHAAKKGLMAYSLNVTYARQLCGKPVHRALDSAPVVFVRNGRIVARATLSRAGKAKVRLKRGSYEVWAQLHNKAFHFRADKAQLIPPGGDRSTMYLDLGAIHAGSNDLTAPARQANVWSQLQQNLRFASGITVAKPLPAVEVRLNVDDVVSSYVAKEHRFYFIRSQELNDPAAIAHEFGHYVMFSNLKEDDAQGGHHDLDVSYAARPGLAFYEGWAWAYTAVEQRHHTVWKSNETDPQCRGFDLSASTPTQPLQTPFFAEYNEEAAAYVIYHLAGYLGHQNLGRGLAAIVHVFNAQKVDGRDVLTMRDLRDALIQDFEVKLSPDQQFLAHNAINAIFAQYGMSWGLTVLADQEQNEGPGWVSHRAITFRIQGPTSCQADDADGGTVNGPLDYTWTDECIAGGTAPVGDYDPFIADAGPWPGAVALLAVPYIAGGLEQNLPYTVYVEFTCGNTQRDPGETEPPYLWPDSYYQCPGEWKDGNIDIRWMKATWDANNQLLPPQPPIGNDASGDPAHGDTVIHTTLGLGQPIPLVRFKADGSDCQILLTGKSCYTGPEPDRTLG